jgi:acyl transferase domain-containing protein
MSAQASTEERGLLEDALRQLRSTRARLEAAQRERHEPIAVLGVGVRLPGGVEDPDAFWRLLRDGRDAVSPLLTNPDGRRPASNEHQPEAHPAGHQAGLLSRVDGFDAGFFGISDGEAERMDPQQRLVLEVAWEAVEQAGLPVERLKQANTGVFLGLYGNDYMSLQLTAAGEATVYTAPGAAHSIAANRLSYLLDLKGPSLAIDTACSSSLVAVHLACRALRDGECDLALVGGVNLILSPISTLVTEKVLPLSPGGRCRTFDAAADGIVRGEGCGMLLLQRATDAQSEDRRVRALIRGSAVNQDGRTNGLTAPNPRAQVEVIRRALVDASADPADVVYVEAHGTGTPLGDPIEVEALCDVYGQGKVPCALGSVKTNLGHLEAASGIAGLVKAILVLEHDEIPPHLNLERLNAEIELEGTRLTVPTQATALPETATRPLAGVSSFGFGGTNAHVVLEAAPIPEATPIQEASPTRGATPTLKTTTPGGATQTQETTPTGEQQPAPTAESRPLMLALSARSEAALVALARAYAERLTGLDPDGVADVCAAAGIQRTHHSHRLCALGSDRDELIAELEACAQRPSRPRRAAQQRVAFIFSGQGAQWAGMGRELLAREPVVRQEVEACDAVIAELAGWSILEQLQAPEGANRLHETEVTQLSIGALQLGLAALLRFWGIRPDALVGHSMGEIVACCAGGALDRTQALELLLARARIIERAARGGAMASIGLPVAETQELLVRTAPGVGIAPNVGIAAVNGPRSTVVAGAKAEVEAVLAAAAADGVKLRALPVEYAFHSPLLEGCDAELKEQTTHLHAREADAALYSTVTGSRVRAAELDGAHWGRNLRDAVLFRAAIAALAEDGVSVFVELAPHPVLLRDIGETLEELAVEHTLVGTLRREHSATASLARSLGDLYRTGLDIRWDSVALPSRTPVSLPTYPWQRHRHWLATVGDPTQQAATAHLRAQLNGVDLNENVDDTEPNGAEANGAQPAAPPSQEQIDALVLFLRERICEATDFEDVEQVPRDRPVELLGIESLTIVELKNQVERDLAVTVPLAVLLGGATLDDLAAVIAAAMQDRRSHEQVAQ